MRTQKIVVGIKFENERSETEISISTAKASLNAAKRIDYDKTWSKIGSSISNPICIPKVFFCEHPNVSETQKINQPKAFEKSRQIFVGFEFRGFEQLPAVHFCKPIISRHPKSVLLIRVNFILSN